MDGKQTICFCRCNYSDIKYDNEGRGRIVDTQCLQEINISTNNIVITLSYT